MVANYGNFSMHSIELQDDFDLLMRLRRPSKYPATYQVDREFQALLDKHQVDYSQYGYALGNYETSYNSIKKYRPKLNLYNRENFAKAALMLRMSYAAVKPCKLTYDYLDWMEPTTSPGYPWNLAYRTKKDALQDGLVYTYVVEMVDSKRKPVGIFLNACKKEPKKWEKILSHNTRVILGAPLETQAVGSYLFSTQNDYIHQAAREYRIPSTVGTTHFYMGWHDIYRRMTRGGALPEGLAADYTEFDGSAIPDEFWVLRDLRFGLYDATVQTPEVYTQVTDYYDVMINTVIIMDCGDVLQKHVGNPSGQNNTIDDNSMINELRWYYMWCESTPDEWHTLESFKKHCELITCGDDSLISVSREAQYFFTVSKIKEIGEKMNWKFKFEMVEYKPIHLLTYCSKSFKWYMGYVVPVPSNPQKQLASLLYGSKRKPDLHREALTRILGIRLESFFLPQFRSLLDEYIEFLLDKYGIQLRCDPPKDMASFDALMSMKRDWVSAVQLFLGDLELDGRDWHPALQGSVPDFGDSHITDLKLKV